jgi:hypothetical protein
VSSQLQDYFEEAVETVARLLYARNRTPREPGWMNLEPQMREGAIRDARVVIDLWIKVSSPCLWCRGTGRTADHHPCTVCGGVGFQRFNADRPEGCRAPHCWSEYGTPCGTCPVLAASADKGWSPGIDDPEPPALGDIDTGEGWYQT